MKKIVDSERIKLLEKLYSRDITDLLYDLHYVRDFKHKQIAWLLNIPRPTITRWFRELDIPTKSCHRYTKQNLTSWLYKTGRLQKKPRYKGPDRRIQQTKRNVNINFFKHWSCDMAYVLGFFAADGGMFKNPRGSKYIQFASTDKEILEKIKKLMSANHKIGIKKSSINDPRRKKCYQLQIGSEEMYNDLLKWGFTPKKDKRLEFPEMPNFYFGDFVRGYFDGDGFVTHGWYKRKNRNNRKYFQLQAGFTCGNRNLLENLSSKLSLRAALRKGLIHTKTRSWDLRYGRKDALKLAKYMYKKATLDSFLERKYNKFQEAFEILGDVAQ